MGRIPDSRLFYLVAGTVFAAVIFVAVELLKGWNGAVALGLALATGLSAGFVIHREATGLAAAVAKTEQRSTQLAQIRELSAGYSGALGPEEIGGTFLGRVRRLVPGSVTSTLLGYEEAAATFRVIAEDGPRGGRLGVPGDTVARLPEAMQERLVTGHRSVIVADTAASPDWTDFAARSGAMADVRWFAALPLVSRSRLIGALFLQAEAPEAFSGHELQLIPILGQYVAGALHNAFSLVEAEARADREALVNRISQRFRSSLDPDEVIAITAEEAGRALGVSRALVCAGDTPETLTVVKEWRGDGVAPVAAVRDSWLPLARRAADEARTIVGSDPGDAVATPIRLGRQVFGVLVFQPIGVPRRWTGADLSLVEAVASELRVALETARAFHQQQGVVTELERLNAAKNDFLSVVSHEFRTPLTGIQGFSEMLRDDEVSMAEVREYAGAINADAQRLTRMVNEMLDLDRLQSGRVTLELRPVDLNAVVTAVTTNLRPTEPGHAFVLQLDPALGAVAGDGDQLTQVMVNLLNNAVKYSPGGGEVVVATRQAGDLAEVSVRDHGIGIPASGLETIFERYARLSSDASRFIQGTGLGLPIVREIVTLHGGRVWAESTLGHGSTFRLTIPLARPAGV